MAREEKVTLLAGKQGREFGTLKELVTFKFDPFDCKLNHDLVELFKVLY